MIGIQNEYRKKSEMIPGWLTRVLNKYSKRNRIPNRHLFIKNMTPTCWHDWFTKVVTSYGTSFTIKQKYVYNGKGRTSQDVGFFSPETSSVKKLYWLSNDRYWHLRCFANNCLQFTCIRNLETHQLQKRFRDMRKTKAKSILSLLLCIVHRWFHSVSFLKVISHVRSAGHHLDVVWVAF